MEETEAMKLAEKTNYLNKNIDYLKNIKVTEFDIHAAGFSVIKFLKLLPAEEIERLTRLPKFEKNVAIGLRIRDNPSIGIKIEETLQKVRKAFVAVNNVDARNILSIKKDAIFVIKENPNILNIKDFFQFARKNTYTSYARLSNIEFYFSNSQLDIKGLSKDNVAKCSLVLEEIKKIFSIAEKMSDDVIFQFVQTFSKKYLNRELPIESYRELDSGYFRIMDSKRCNFFEECDESFLQDLDITQNYVNYIKPLLTTII